MRVLLKLARVLGSSLAQQGTAFNAVVNKKSTVPPFPRVVFIPDRVTGGSRELIARVYFRALARVQVENRRCAIW